MKVSELMDALSRMPPEAEVMCAWDGALRGESEVVWLTRAGKVAIGDRGEVIYNTHDRPEDAPTREEEKYWKTPR